MSIIASRFSSLAKSNIGSPIGSFEHPCTWTHGPFSAQAAREWPGLDSPSLLKLSVVKVEVEMNHILIAQGFGFVWSASYAYEALRILGIMTRK